MSPINSVQNIATNTCPHGLSPGACPICSGGAGGVKKRPTNEWSWEKCYSVGLMMKAQRTSTLESKQMFQAQLNLFVQNAQKILDNIKNALPPQLRAAFSKIAKNILSPLLTMVQNVPKAINDIKDKLLDVSQKLSALLGEIKNFVDRKLIKNLKKLTKKFLSFFIFEDDELIYDDEELEAFRRIELSKIKIILLNLKGKLDVKCDKN